MSVLFSQNETLGFTGYSYSNTSLWMKYQEKKVFAVCFNKDIPKNQWSGAPNSCVPHGGWVVIPNPFLKLIP